MAFDIGRNHRLQSGFVVGERHGNKIMGMLPYGGFIFRVTAVDSATVIYAEVLKQLGGSVGAPSIVSPLADLFVNNFQIVGVKTTGAYAGVARAITGYDSNLGKLTIATFGGALTVGDMMGMVPVGSAQGALIVIHKGTTITPTTAGADLTGVATGGAILIEEIGVQKITTLQAVGLTSLVVISNDTAPLNHTFVDEAGGAVQSDDLVVGARYVNRINWSLASSTKLTAKTTGVNGTAGYLWTIKARALAQGATLATA